MVSRFTGRAVNATIRHVKVDKRDRRNYFRVIGIVELIEACPR